MNIFFLALGVVTGVKAYQGFGWPGGILGFVVGFAMIPLIGWLFVWFRRIRRNAEEWVAKSEAD